MNLEFGLHREIPAEVTTAWGARWIFPNDMLPDRQDMKGPDIEPLKQWLNGGALAKARESALLASRHFALTQDGSDTVILFRDSIGVVVANPNRSFGYVYVAAWLHNGNPALSKYDGTLDLTNRFPGQRTTTKAARKKAKT